MKHAHKKYFWIGGVVLVVILIVAANGRGLRDFSYRGDGASQGAYNTSAPGFAGVGGGVADELSFAESVVSSKRSSAPTSPTDFPQGDAALIDTADRQVIRNGFLALTVEETQMRVDEISDLVDQYNGFLENASIYEVYDGVVRADMTIRIPEASFLSVIDAIKTLAVDVEHEQIGSNDVTDQIIDLDAQLRNLKATETQLLKVMERAFDISDILQVQRELTNVRDRIERLTARQQYLHNQVAFATLTLSLTSEPDVDILGVGWKPLLVVKDAVRTMIDDLRVFADIVIRFVIYIPVLLVWLVVIGVLGWCVRWLHHRLQRSRHAHRASAFSERHSYSAGAAPDRRP